MKRSAPMRRTPMTRRAPPGWQRPDRGAEFASFVPHATSAAVMACDLAARAPMVVDKDNPLRSEDYRRYVAALPCWLCHIEGWSQAAHADQGKGAMLKTDDRTCFPACGPHPVAGMIDPGCHHLIGSTGRLGRDERRALELRAGAETQQALRDRAATDTVLRTLLIRIGVMT